MVIEEPMLQKDPSRYLRNTDIDGSSPKEASGPIPKKFRDMHYPSPDPKIQQQEHQKFRTRQKEMGLQGHDAIKKPFLKTIDVDSSPMQR